MRRQLASSGGRSDDAPDQSAIEALRQTFGAAMDYGLSYEEVWAVVNEVVERTPPDTPVGEALDEIAAALSSRIHEKRGEL